MAARALVVNADDFGQSPGVNRGVIEAHERGIVTSASLMVRWPAAREAAAYAREHPELSLGLHVDLGEWRHGGDGWVPVYEVVDAEDADAVAAEVARQIEAFRVLTGRDPTHLDSHQHVHRDEPARSIIHRAAADLGVPLRGLSDRVTYRGDFYGQTGRGEPHHEAISMDALTGVIRSLPQGTTELGCHPGDGADLDSMYRAERAEEVRVLCDPAVRAVIEDEGIELRSFADVLVTDQARGG